MSTTTCCRPRHATRYATGYLHIHDKDYYPTKSLTCVQHPLDRILQYGFTAGHGESRPAKRIETASIIGCISLETAQNEMHGGQAIPAFDFYLAPFVRSSYIERSRIWNLFQEKTCHTSTTPKSTISSSATSMASKMRHACSNTP